MKMIGHDLKTTDFNTSNNLRHLLANLLNHSAGVIHNHFAIKDRPKQAQSVLRHDGDEICPILRIIKIRQTVAVAPN